MNFFLHVKLGNRSTSLFKSGGRTCTITAKKRENDLTGYIQTKPKRRLFPLPLLPFKFFRSGTTRASAYPFPRSYTTFGRRAFRGWRSSSRTDPSGGMTCSGTRVGSSMSTSTGLALDFFFNVSSISMLSFKLSLSVCSEVPVITMSSDSSGNGRPSNFSSSSAPMT